MTGVCRTEALLDRSGVALHVSAEGRVPVLAAVLCDPEHLVLRVHAVVFQALNQEILELLARVGAGVRDARNLVEHVAGRGGVVRGRCLRDERLVHAVPFKMCACSAC